MKFTVKFFYYGVNDDNTVTVYVVDENNTKQFFRARARYKLLGYLDELVKDTQLVGTYGLAYQKGVGLVLQLIEVTEA